MALSDVEIRAEIRAERLVFDPPINADADGIVRRIGSSSVDLLLHERLIILGGDRESGVIIDPSARGFNVMDFLEKNGRTEVIPEGGSYQMEPNHLVIARTLETVRLPLHLAARVEGKSSLARLGLSVHVTAPAFTPGLKARCILK